MPQGIDWLHKLPVCGVHTATDADATANAIDFPTGKTAATGFVVQAFRSGVLISADVKASITGGVLKVEDGSTYKITAGDLVCWIVI